MESSGTYQTHCDVRHKNHQVLNISHLSLGQVSAPKPRNKRYKVWTQTLSTANNKDKPDKFKIQQTNSRKVKGSQRKKKKNQTKVIKDVTAEEYIFGSRPVFFTTQSTYTYRCAEQKLTTPDLCNLGSEDFKAAALETQLL